MEPTPPSPAPVPASAVRNEPENSTQPMSNPDVMKIIMARLGAAPSVPESVPTEGVAAGERIRVKFTEDQFILVLAQLADHPDFQGIDLTAMVHRLHEVFVCHREEIDDPEQPPTAEPLDLS